MIFLQAPERLSLHCWLHSFKYTRKQTRNCERNYKTLLLNTLCKVYVTSHLFMMCLPISVEPVKPSFRTSGWSERRWPTRAPRIKNKMHSNSRSFIRWPQLHVMNVYDPTWSRQNVNHSFRQSRSCCQFSKLQCCQWGDLKTNNNMNDPVVLAFVGSTCDMGVWPVQVWGPLCFQLPGRLLSSRPASLEGSSKESQWHKLWGQIESIWNTYHTHFITVWLKSTWLKIFCQAHI